MEMVVGTQVHKEVFLIDADEATKKNEMIGNSGGKLTGDRNVVSGYMELSLPLTSNVDWSLAGRQDLSNFGQALRTSLNWQISPRVRLYSSIGQGFKAPNINDLYQDSYHGYVSFIDQKTCIKSGYCRPQERRVVTKGNRNLKEEKSFSTSLGTSIQANESISLGIETWYLKINNQVNMDYEDLTLAEHRLGTKHIKEFGIQIVRDPVTGQIEEVTALTQNLSETETSGLDLSTEFFTNTKMGSFVLGLQHSHLFFKKMVGFPGLEKRDKLRKAGFPPWRNIVFLTYAPTNNQSGSLTARTVAAHEKLFAKAGQHKAHTEFDIQYTYNGFWGGLISIGMRNLLGTLPPIDDSDPNFPKISTALYDGNGRMGWVQYKHNF